jgi:DNA-binding transcriptional LysR family regulator
VWDKRLLAHDCAALPYSSTMLDVHRLTILRAVVASGSIHAAATNLGYTPSTISQHIRTLQQETGLTLFETSGRGITPTAAGLQLATESEEVLICLARLEATVADLRDGRSSSLVLACFASVAQAWIPSLAAALSSHIPGVLLEISLNEPHEGPGRRPPDIDVRTESLRDPPPVLEGFRRYLLREEELRVVVPHTHAAAAAPQVALASLAGEPWIDNDVYDSPTGQIVSQACRAAGFTPRYVARSDDHHAAVSLVAAGLGVTVLPELALQRVPRTVTHVALVNPTPRRRIVAHVRESVAHLPTVRAGLRLLQRSARR